MTATDAGKLRVVIVGGGSAGYLAALTLRQLAGDARKLEVVVLDPCEIPTIGVGESTTSEMPAFLHGVLGVDAARFYREVDPTWKLGIRFKWGSDPEGFYYPFDRGDLLEPLHHLGHFRHATLASMLMSVGRVPMLKVSETGLIPMLASVPHGYHIDSAKFLGFLKALCLERGIQVLDEVVSRVLVSDLGTVSALHYESGGIERADLYVDCSGFRGALVREALGEGFLSFGTSLYCDRAWIGRVDNSRQPAPYTTAETMDCGWLWTIPQRHEDHVGYVFSSRYSDDADARDALTARVPGVEVQRLIPFRSGRLEHWIRGNVAAIGNAYGFVEPLESTALFVIVRQCLLVARNLRALVHGRRDVEERLNREMASVWDYLRWFLAIHYRFNTRSDSPFWRDCRAHVNVDGADAILAKYSEAAPRFGLEPTERADTNFDTFGFDVLLLGQRAPVTLRSSEVSAEDYAERQRPLADLTKHAVSQQVARAALDAQPELLDQLRQRESWLTSFSTMLSAQH